MGLTPAAGWAGGSWGAAGGLFAIRSGDRAGDAVAAGLPVGGSGDLERCSLGCGDGDTCLALPRSGDGDDLRALPRSGDGDGLRALPLCGGEDGLRAFRDRDRERDLTPRRL